MRDTIQKIWQKFWFQCVFFAFISAALLVLSFPSYSIWPLSFIGYVPLLYFSLRFKSGDLKRAFVFGLLISMFFIWLGFGWISYVATNFGGLPWIVGKLVLLGYSLFGEIQFLIFSLAVFFWVQHRKKFTLRDLFLLPVFYVAIDYLNPKIFPNTVGHVLYGWFSAIQVVEWTGVYFFTYLVLLTNVMLLVVLVKNKWLQGRLKSVAEVSTKIECRRKVALGSLFGVLVVLCLCSLWGSSRIRELKEIEQSTYKKIRISIIQANIGDAEKLASEGGLVAAVRKVLQTYRDMTVESVERYKPDLVIWPETAYPYLYTHFLDEYLNRTGAAKDQWIADLINDIHTPLFFGTYSSLNGRDFNSAFLVTPPLTLLGVYRKSILLAFGEYVPLGPLGPIVQKWIPSIADFGRGQGAAVIEFKKTMFAPQICYEGIFPDHSRRGVELGADVLLNITNDSWFGSGTEPWLHFFLTVFRNIEVRRPMIRGTNTGISAIIDVTGRVIAQTGLFEKQAFEQEVLVPSDRTPKINTFYLKMGEWFAKLCFALSAAILFKNLYPYFMSKLGHRFYKRK